MTSCNAVAAAISTARHVCVLTGAGASAESGIPTFRDAQSGLWARYNPQDLATAEAFSQEPDLVWQWYSWRRNLVLQANPNAGHLALVELATLTPKFSLITQNVDGLHQRAGQQNVIEYHGNLFDQRCFDCSFAIDANCAAPQNARCPKCSGRIRPGVVWFGESIPEHAVAAAESAARDCDVFLLVGTSALVWPAAGLADLALQNNSTVVEINPDVTALTSSTHHRLASRSGAVLPEIVKMCRDNLGQK